MRAKISVLAVFMLASAGGSALAQQAPGVSLPPLPGGASGGQPTGPLIPLGPIPMPGMPSAAGAGQSAGPSAPTPVQPQGGFGATPPAPGSADPAKRMTLQGASDYSQTVQTEARQQLQNMTGVSGGGLPSPGGPLGTAPIASQSDLEEMTKIQRNIAVLDAEVKQAELAVKLWHTLFNNDDAKAWREDEKKAKEAAFKTDAAAKDLSKGGGSIHDLMTTPVKIPAGQEIKIAADPVLLEVIGGVATIRIPGSGDLAVRAGQHYADGKIISVSVDGVIIERDGKRRTIGFGSSGASSVGQPVPSALPSGIAPSMSR